MCWRAALEFRDMEMLQFHPTGLRCRERRRSQARCSRKVCAAREPPDEYARRALHGAADPVLARALDRDVVARASYVEILEGRGTPAGGVLLDVSHLGAAEVERRFGEMAARTRLVGADLATGPVEVSPTAHFHMGGVIIDPDCMTSVHGLLVAGEDAGRHPRREPPRRQRRRRVDGVRRARRGGGGCNRAGTGYLHARPEAGRGVGRASVRAAAPGRRARTVRLTDGLKEAMWVHCGLVRTRTGLLQARERLAETSGGVVAGLGDRPSRGELRLAASARSREPADRRQADRRVRSRARGVAGSPLPRRLSRARRRRLAQSRRRRPRGTASRS